MFEYNSLFGFLLLVPYSESAFAIFVQTVQFVWMYGFIDSLSMISLHMRIWWLKGFQFLSAYNFLRITTLKLWSNVSPCLQKYAADKAARENRDVTVQTASGTAAGRPVQQGLLLCPNWKYHEPRLSSLSSSTKAVYLSRCAAIHSSHITHLSLSAGQESYDDNTRTTGTTTGLSASGVRGLDVQPGEVIDRKYYTGVEDRPQEQALGKPHNC